MPKDFYSILGVERSATTEEVKRAYRKLAHRHHPDKGGDQEKFKEVNEAYQVLSNEEKRRQYDQFGQTFEGAGVGGQGTGGGFDPFGSGFNVRFEDLGGLGDIFSQFFGGQSPFGTRAGTRRRARHVGADIELQLTVPFEEMVQGGKRELPLNRLQTCPHCKGNLAEPGTKIVACQTCAGSGVVEHQSRTVLGAFVQRSVCPTCHGEGKRPEQPCKECRGEGRTRQMETLVVRIPPGIENGTRLRISREGEAPPYGGDPGDLYVLVHVRDHPRFRRDGNDVVSALTIPFTTAALGGEVPVETIQGTENLSIPRGTSSGTEFRIKGKGIALGRHSETGKRGDHRVTVVIDVPRRLTKQQEELLRKFEDPGTKKGFRLF